MIANMTFDFSAIDEFAVTLAVVGYITVFAALVVLFYIYSLIPKIIDISVRQKLRRKGKHKIAEKENLSMVGEENAAIAMALHLYFSESHDEESNVLTFKNSMRSYTPWSSRIYNMNEYYRRP
jgi:Na+-transporting methylmalonyl-CoA/oxaloacetate decarboxylase gamma subunit